MTKNYHEYTMYLGESDIAALILVYFEDPEHHLKTDIIRFGGDNGYRAYLIDDTYEIPARYTHRFTFFPSWFKIYDDSGLTVKAEITAPMHVYSAGSYGLIFKFDSSDDFEAMKSYNRY